MKTLNELQAQQNFVELSFKGNERKYVRIKECCQEK
jgi:hypothetical protein